ncbi:hypothetical protein SALWKB12_0005 [Snodgrassella communis]|uniref:Uncharacterized protein n=1 Tax=Snodgrassella communis TaxID=2946699 RepID=A0A836Z445_9NEIS|nr:hypothetical protein SALWKB12_0005 [Snodgrassella communis]KDN14378.1 hypothetical protein SALWKB29_1467 [Snodgrassella communis]
MYLILPQSPHFYVLLTRFCSISAADTVIMSASGTTTLFLPRICTSAYIRLIHLPPTDSHNWYIRAIFSVTPA